MIDHMLDGLGSKLRRNELCRRSTMLEENSFFNNLFYDFATSRLFIDKTSKLIGPSYLTAIEMLNVGAAKLTLPSLCL